MQRQEPMADRAIRFAQKVREGKDLVRIASEEEIPVTPNTVRYALKRQGYDLSALRREAPPRLTPHIIPRAMCEACKGVQSLWPFKEGASYFCKRTPECRAASQRHWRKTTNVDLQARRLLYQQRAHWRSKGLSPEEVKEMFPSLPDSTSRVWGDLNRAMRVWEAFIAHDRRISQRQLASLVDMSPGGVYAILTGDHYPKLYQQFTQNS